MSHINLCFVWHMHQPFYKDLATGEYQLPWTRMHALKDYYGMVKVLKDFPEVRQTFNLVPSMMIQIEEYARGEARDPFFRCAVKPAEDLSREEQEFILRYFFQANPARLIYRYPRYAELYEAWIAANRNPSHARRFFAVPAMRDLQVLSQLAWFDEEYVENDPETRQLIAKGRDFSLDDQQLMARKQIEIVGQVLPVYKEFAARGQIELSVTPYYHPILPLLCDSSIARIASPHAALPSRFAFPGDAQLQIQRAKEYAEKHLGVTPAGMWPSEGSVSDEVLTLAAGAGFRWTATDNGVLAATLGHVAGPKETYQPYLWEQEGNRIHIIFRDHFLSDAIGFVYSMMDASSAARHFLESIRANCRPMLGGGREVLVPIILDGENAWEYYDRNGRPFLREVYRMVQEDPQLSALTVSEALDRLPSSKLPRIFPGSWINANFDVWIGAEEDNRAWEYLLRARQTYEQVIHSAAGERLSEAQRELALEELLIAEGSDWCWWYGPEHHSENRVEFDRLFRDHLSQVYRALGLAPPDELSRPIAKLVRDVFHEPPSAVLKPTIDGEVTSYFEWMGAGLYTVDRRSGAMHGKRIALQEVHYGPAKDGVAVRLDLDGEAGAAVGSIEIQLTLQVASSEPAAFRFRLSNAGAELLSPQSDPAAVFQFRRVFEVLAPYSAIGPLAGGEPIRLKLSLWLDGLPVDAVPAEGWLTIQPVIDAGNVR